MKKIFFACIALLSTVFAIAQNETVINDANAEIRNVGNFNAVKVSHGIELVLKQGETEAVAVSASSTDYRNHIKTEVVNGVLKIYYDTEKWLYNSITKNMHLKAYVSARELTMLQASSGASISVDGALHVGSLSVNLSSGSNIKGEIIGIDVKVDQSSGSVARVSGKIKALSVEASSGSVFYGFDMVTENCEAEASSGGSIQITVNKELNAEASSGGGVRYKGDGVIRNISTSSGGSVSRKS